MHAGPFDEEALFRGIAESGARALMIGRRALIALGVPIDTFDYDFWLDPDDIEIFNQAAEPLDLFPNRSAEEARRFERYVLENDQRIDVLVARQASTRDGGTILRFEDAWARRQRVHYSGDLHVVVPCIDDLLVTKRWSLRRKDLTDIDILEKLKRESEDR